MAELDSQLAEIAVGLAGEDTVDVCAGSDACCCTVGDVGRAMYVISIYVVRLERGIVWEGVYQCMILGFEMQEESEEQNCACRSGTQEV